MTFVPDPNEMEYKLLREAEPKADLVAYAPPGISDGRQSLVTVLKFKFASAEELIMWKRMGAGKKLTKAEAEAFHSRLRPYRRSLRKAGWNIPKLFHTYVVKVKKEWQIFSYEQFIPGGDAEHKIKDTLVPNYHKWFLLRTPIETLAEYDPLLLHRQNICGREVTALPHGLDLKLANIIGGEGEDQVWFVDLFGPKELDDKNNWVSYNEKLDSLPEENLRAVSASREGAILRLFRLAEKSWVKSQSISEEALHSNFRDVLEQSGIPEHEIMFILSEIEAGYPWLDKIYQETLV